MLNLVVIRSGSLERSRSFYEAVRLLFVVEQHGDGPRHLAATIGELVFEVYPRRNRSSEGVRLGFEVASLADTEARLRGLGFEPRSSAPGASVFVDPDGHVVELRAAE